MTKTEFQRRCSGRRRMLRVAGTWCWVYVSRLQAEQLREKLNGAVTVDDDDEGYAWIAAAAAPEDGA